jgi:phosphoglycerate dehydrogenase-like enzyme
MPTILLELPISPEARAALAALPGVQLIELPRQPGEWHVSASIGREVEVLLCRLPPRNLDDMPGLKLVQLGTVGYEHLKDRGFLDRPIRVCNARGIFDTAIAEWNVAMMINLLRDLRRMLRNQDHSVWEKASPFGEEVRDRVVGLWGYGGIGRETARLATALGMHVDVMTRAGISSREGFFAWPGTGDPDGRLPRRVFVAGQEKEFLSGLDFLVLALPHTKESGGLVGAEQLRALPRRAFLLNPARGLIVREEALLQALREGWIAGAALDTHFRYPLPADHPLWRFPNVILTPHVSGTDRSAAFPARIGKLLVENVERYLAGRPLLNELTRQEWIQA